MLVSAKTGSYQITVQVGPTTMHADPWSAKFMLQALLKLLCNSGSCANLDCAVVPHQPFRPHLFLALLDKFWHTLFRTSVLCVCVCK